MSYSIVRFYFKHDSEVIKTGLDLDEAQEHCNDPETSHSTATSDEATERTRLYGPWFDGYREE
jgi:hypothetical protein